MKILSKNVYVGPNIYANFPVIRYQIDIGELERVVNYDLPDQVDDYIHRIGRTGRAGAKGEAVSLVSKDNFRNLCAIESKLGHVIVRKAFADFPVKKEVPVSILNYVPKNKR